jgi:hypothetical protein
MNLQFIADSQGKVTGVYIPINECNALKKQYIGIEDEAAAQVPAWQRELVEKRLKAYDAGGRSRWIFDSAIDHLEKEI